MTGKSALILVAGFGFILGYISMNLSKIGRMANHGSSLYYESEVAHNIAVAGAHAGLSKVFQDTSWYGPPINVDLRPYNIPANYTVERDGQIIRSTSIYESYDEELQYTVTVYLAPSANQSFSLFAWMTNSENGVQWVTSDTVWGRVHTNDRINVDGSPTFMRKVTTVHGFNAAPGTSPNDGNFEESWESGVDSIIFPTSLTELITAANDGAAGGRYFDSTAIWVTLSPGNPSVNGDGMAYIRETELGGIIDSVALNPATFNGVILGNQRVNVQGTLDGILTIASNIEIYIQNDIVYQDDPRLVTSDDMLGLVAEGQIVIADNTVNRTNCIIHASIFSRSDSFRAQDHGNGVLRGTLSILGSLVQDRRGPVGTHSGGVINSGYSKRYRYDERLANPTVRPPFFPSFWTRTLPVTGWWESYRLPDYGKSEL